MNTLDRAETDRLPTYAAMDIETTGLDGTEDSLVAIGVGYQAEAVPREVEVHTLADARGDEVALIETAFAWLDRREPAGLVTYNGTAFDLPFLAARLDALGAEVDLTHPGRHVDLFTERQRLATLADERWPSLEACLEAYDLPVAVTDWEGDVLTNRRFGEELAPRYVHALETMEFAVVHAIERVIRDYTAADIEATLALYEVDLRST